MTRPRVLRLAVLGALLALAATACGGGGSGGSSGGTIVIGASLSLSGDLGVLGPPLQDGYKQEVADVNKAGGISVGGKKEQVKLVILDNASDPNKASSQSRELVLQDHAVALLGFTTPPIVTPEALAAEQLRVPFLTSLTPVEAFASGNKDGWQYSWDFFFDEKQQATDAAKAVASVSSNKKAVVFTDNEPDGVVERPLYKAAMAADGLDVVGDYTFPVGTTDYSSFINQAKAHGAQLVVGQMAPADGVALWKQFKSFGFHPQAAFLAKASDADYWYQSLGSIAQDTLSEGYWNPAEAPSAQLAKISPTLGKRYANNPNYAGAAVAYGVAELLTEAIAKAGSTDPDKLNAAIGQGSFQTTTGTVKFNDKTHTAITPYYITQWQNGNLVQVEPPISGVKLDVPTAGLG